MHHVAVVLFPTCELILRLLSFLTLVSCPSPHLVDLVLFGLLSFLAEWADFRVLEGQLVSVLTISLVHSTDAVFPQITALHGDGFDNHLLVAHCLRSVFAMLTWTVFHQSSILPDSTLPDSTIPASDLGQMFLMP